MSVRVLPKEQSYPIGVLLTSDWVKSNINKSVHTVLKLRWGRYLKLMSMSLGNEPLFPHALVPPPQQVERWQQEQIQECRSYQSTDDDYCQRVFDLMSWLVT